MSCSPKVSEFNKNPSHGNIGSSPQAGSVQLLILATIFCCFTPEPVLAESVDSSIQAGISNYRQQNFEQAELEFSKAQEQQPNNPELNYNLANSHYKNGKYQEAFKSYGDAASNETTPGLQQNSLYNSGNALYRLGKLEESIAAYQKVLELDPNDMDAKFNLEFVREKLKKNQKDQKQNQPQEQDSDGNQNSKQNPSPENNNENDGQDSAQQENQEPSLPEDQDQNSDPSGQTDSNPLEQAQNPENSITKDQAEQWLNGLDEDLKKFSQKQAAREKGKNPDSGKDW